MGVDILSIPESIFAKTPISTLMEVTEIDDDYTTYKLMLQVWVETEPYSGDFVFVAELEQPVNEEFDARFFIDSKLREALNYSLPLLGEDGIQVAERVCKRYKLKYGVKTRLSMELVDEFYHRGSGYVKVPVAEPLVLGDPYATIAYTSKLSAIGNVKYYDGLSQANVNFLTDGLWGNRAIAYTTVVAAGLDNITEISIPPNIKFELYKNPVEYTELGTVFGALLGAESLKSFGLPTAVNEAAFDEAFDLAFQSPYEV